MTTRSRGPSAGFGWLSNGVSVVFRHPKPLFGGAALVTLAALLPSLITMPVQFHALHTGTPLPPATSAWIMAFSLLFSLLLLPLYAGYIQLIDAAERGLPARVSDIFKPYRAGQALNVIGYGLVQMVIYFAMFGAVIATTGRDVARWYMQAVAAQAAHQPPPSTLPDGFGITMLLFVAVVLFMLGFYSIGLGQVALRNRSAFAAIGDGMIGAIKNLLPLLMFALAFGLAWIVAAIAFGIIAVVLMLIGKLVSPWLVIALVVPFYIALLLLVFSAMYGVMYQLWRDVCGDDIAAGETQPFEA